MDHDGALKQERPGLATFERATAYPQSLLQDWSKLGRLDVNASDWDMVLQKYRIDTVLWIKNHEALRQFLVGARGWKESPRWVAPSS